MGKFLEVLNFGGLFLKHNWFVSMSMFTHYHYKATHHDSVGLAWELDSHIRLNPYCTAGRARKSLLGWNSLGLLWPNFQFLYKRIIYQYLTIFDQIES